MKILRIVYDWPPPWTGLTPQPYEITRAQQQMGDQVTVMSGRWPKAGALEVPNGVKVITVWRAPLQGTVIFTSALLMFFKYLFWRKKNTPDVIHVHGHFGYWLLVYRNFLHKLKPWHEELQIPLVYHYHITYKGRWEEAKKKGKSIKFSSEKIEWPLMVKSDRIAAKIASACIFTSINVKQEAVTYYKVKEEKCFVVESGVNTGLFKDVTRDEKDKTRKELGFDPFDKVILNYGFIVERKNIHLLVESLKYLPPEYKLLLVGPSEEAYEEKLNTMLKELNLRDRVVRVEYTPYPQVPIAIQAADIFVLPSSYEGFPKVVLEALSCGKPVLASGFEVSSEIGGLAFLKSLEPNNIATQIQDTLNSRVVADINLVKQKYSWEVKALEIRAAYEYAQKHKII